MNPVGLAALLAVLLLCVMLGGCGATETPQDTGSGDDQYQTEDQNLTEDDSAPAEGPEVLQEFYASVEGVWGALSEDGEVVDFFTFYDNNKMRYGFYPGDYDRECEITAAKHYVNGQFELSIFAAATEASEMEEAQPDYSGTVYINSNDGYKEDLLIDYGNGMVYNCSYIAKTIDEALPVFDGMLSQE